MIRFRKYVSHGVAALVGAATMAAPPQARAGFAVDVYDDGVLQGGVFSFVSGSPGAYSLIFVGTTTHFSLNGSGISDNPGTPSDAHLQLGSNEQVSANFGTSGGTHTIKIVISEDGWTNPMGNPLLLSSSPGGSFGYSAGINSSAHQKVTATYQGFLDNTDTPFGQPAAGSTTIQTASASLGSVGTANLVFSPGVSVNAGVPGGTPFSMTGVLTFTFTLDAGSGTSSANVSASTTAAPPSRADVAPAPTGLVLALTGAPFLGIGAWLRRRRQAA